MKDPHTKQEKRQLAREADLKLIVSTLADLSRSIQRELGKLQLVIELGSKDVPLEDGTDELSTDDVSPEQPPAEEGDTLQ